jgi:tRNA(Ile)-lysidine synthase
VTVQPKGRAVTALLQPVTAALRGLRLAPGSVILGALSGGPDSVALLYALAGLRDYFGYELVAAHLNHRLRGAEADRDENFVRELCAKLGVELVVEQARGLQSSSPNLEERARELRYAFLNRVAERVKANYIAIAHHADDQAETVLMRLLRGSGARGLAAMATHGPGHLWRPLLAVNRATVIAYLEALGATWVTDHSNGSPRILRNRLRGELLPLLEREFAPGVSRRLVELAVEMRTLDEYLTADARAELGRRRDGARLALKDFDQLNEALAQAVLREFLREHVGHLRAITRYHICAMRALCSGANPGGRVPLPGGRQLRREYAWAILESTTGHSADAQPFFVPLNSVGTTLIKPAVFAFEARLLERSTDEHWPLPTTTMEALFDVDKLPDPLTVRNCIAGDRIAPTGMEGTRKLQDLFVDHKVARGLRSRWPLVIADGAILWVPGIARSRLALVTSTTRRTQYLQAIGGPGNRVSVVA